MSSQRTLVIWTNDEVESLIIWMEENEDHLHGKQLAWHKRVKEAVFSTHDHITIKKITDKALNIKRLWKEAKAIRDQSGFGIRPEENDTSINQVLERKCPFFGGLMKYGEQDRMLL